MNKKVSSDCMDMVFKRNGVRGKYSKFTNEHQAIMKTLFEQNYYPSKCEYEKLAEDMNESVDKIINWFKHERRKYLNTGNIESYKKRKIFTKEEEILLEESFKENRRPPAKKYTEISHALNCTRRQIRKWFSYRRIKFEQLKDQQKAPSPAKSPENHKSRFGMTLRRNPLNPKHNKQPKKFPSKKPLSYFLKIKRPTGVRLEASKLPVVKNEVIDQTEKRTTDQTEQKHISHQSFTANSQAPPSNTSFQFLFNFFPFQTSRSVGPSAFAKPTEGFYPNFSHNNYSYDYKFNAKPYPTPNFFPYQANPSSFNPLFGFNQGLTTNLACDPLLMNFLINNSNPTNPILNHLNFLQNLKSLQARNTKI